ncbi:MAG: DUF4846 domain-containing protein [candidate division KSB1 bacterium]|nr:DUF4846 domain-containing protein [candidate division KSB1 bacterium]
MAGTGLTERENEKHENNKQSLKQKGSNTGIIYQMKQIHYILITGLFLCLTGCEAQTDHPQTRQTDHTGNPLIDTTGAVIQNRIRTPQGFRRSPASENSFTAYLRTLPLKAHGSPAKYYDGGSKPNHGVYVAVVDLPIGDQDLHQCADAVMRLRAEYLWQQQQYDSIHFNFTNGFRVDYSEWMQGRRMIVEGNTTRWNNRYAPSNTYHDFRQYMQLIFMYAGTLSLSRELESVAFHKMQIGDVLIQGGMPGHAVIVVDMAKHASTGERIYLLAQSYMPAQEIQILHNRHDSISPWYRLNSDTVIYTPEWSFSKNDLMGFPEK